MKNESKFLLFLIFLGAFFILVPTGELTLLDNGLTSGRLDYIQYKTIGFSLLSMSLTLLFGNFRGYRIGWSLMGISLVAFLLVFGEVSTPHMSSSGFEGYYIVGPLYAIYTQIASICMFVIGATLVFKGFIRTKV
jgi:hypothetical protein